MRQRYSRNFGKNTQEETEKVPPCSAEACVSSGRTPETLSDVGGGAEMRAENSPSINSKGPNGQEPWPQTRGRSQCEAALVCGHEGTRFGNLECEDCQHTTEKNPQTPNASNTGVSIRQTGGGMDWLDVSLYGFWSPSAWNELRPRLLEAAKKCQQLDAESVPLECTEGDVIQILPNGKRHGTFCKFQFEWKGCKVAIVDDPRPSETRLSIFVHIGSLRLMDVGHVEAWRAIEDMLTSLGFCCARTVVGRVDLCVDIPGQGMSEVREADENGAIICRARKDRIYRNRVRNEWETFTTGSPNGTQIRIYDKAIEVRNDPIKRAMMIERRWGEDVQQALRVEFQIRRKSIRRHFNVTSVEELFSNTGTIVRWCTTEWFRMVDQFDRTNRNHGRAKVSEFWSGVQQLFEDWTVDPLPRQPAERSVVPDLSQLKKQALGCVTKVVAVLDDGTDFLTEWMDIGLECVSKAREMVIDKRERLAGKNQVFAVNAADIPF